MARTTIDIDDPVLRDLKRLQKEDGRSLGRLISDLLAQAVSQLRAGKSKRKTFSWIAKPMRARIDLDDKDAVWATLDRDRRRRYKS